MSEWFKGIFTFYLQYQPFTERSFFSIIVFEPEDNEDNEKEYQTLHGEYKNLVSKYTIKLCISSFYGQIKFYLIPF